MLQHALADGEETMMANRPYGVGLIGVEPGRSWAAVAHIPALRTQADAFRVVGVANSSVESARRAAEASGIGRAFDVDELVHADEVDVVAVTVKVPHHRALVTKALEAGKHVFCEWPLGNGLAEAEALAALAREKGVHAVIGTQARVAPAMRHVAELVASGYVGEVLSSTLVGSGLVWGATIDRPNAYTVDAANGATMLTIPFAHTMAAVQDALGPIAAVSAILATRRREVTNSDTGETLAMTAPDQLIVAGEFVGGAPIAAHYRGGTPRGTGLLWEINGAEGDLQMTAVGGHAQLLDLTVSGAHGGDPALTPLPLPEHLRDFPGLDARAGNVARLYAQLARDLRDGSRHAPDFDDAVRLHRLVDAIERAAADGRRIEVEGVGP